MSMKYQPINIDAVSQAFGGGAMNILPPYSAIPSEFKSSGNQWNRWTASWFFKGLEVLPVPKQGIDLRLAMRNLATVMRSWEPKHEHKEAGVAYLASLWFERPDGEPIKESA